MRPLAADLRRWKDRSVRPSGATPHPAPLSTRDVATLLWSHPQLWATVFVRAAAWCHRRHLRLLPTLLQRLNMVLFALEVAPSIPIGPGLYLPHPGGTVIMAEGIGANCSVIHAVTLGMRNEHAFPAVGDGVFIGAGARVLGGVRLGDDSTVGANAVVISDVPPGCTAVGVPARIVPAPRDRPALIRGR